MKSSRMKCLCEKMKKHRKSNESQYLASKIAQMLTDLDMRTLFTFELILRSNLVMIFL